mgnify:FL=1|jgi:enterochelin esterase family protein
MATSDRVIDEIIKRAMESGDFDHLPGTGKPIEWKDNPYTPLEWRLVENLLKNNDLSYPWIEKRKEIEKLVNELKNTIKEILPLSASAQADISNQILSLNKKIFDYNLSVPAVRLQRRTLTLEEMIQCIKQDEEI